MSQPDAPAPGQPIEVEDGNARVLVNTLQAGRRAGSQEGPGVILCGLLHHPLNGWVPPGESEAGNLVLQPATARGTAAALTRCADLVDPPKPPPRIKFDDEWRFKPAVGMATGALADNGNLRLIVTQADGGQVALELPHAWLHGEGCLGHFIRQECHPRRAAK